MRTKVPAKQRVHRILKGSHCFLSPSFRFGRPLPKGVALTPGESLLGGICSGKLESILTDNGAYVCAGAAWQFIAYGDIEDVIFPEKSDTNGALTLRTSSGSFDLLRGRPELWTAGRFFMRCAADAKTTGLDPNHV